jgi:hypothetical protein
MGHPAGLTSHRHDDAENQSGFGNALKSKLEQPSSEPETRARVKA